MEGCSRRTIESKKYHEMTFDVAGLNFHLVQGTTIMKRHLVFESQFLWDVERVDTLLYNSYQNHSQLYIGKYAQKYYFKYYIRNISKMNCLVIQYFMLLYRILSHLACGHVVVLCKLIEWELYLTQQHTRGISWRSIDIVLEILLMYQICCVS